MSGSGFPATLLGLAGAWQFNLLRDLKRVNDYLVVAAGYPVLKGQGELLTTRLRENE
jgi:hypothetical protein